MKNILLYLDNIKECIENIETYTSEGEEVFKQSRLIQDAVIRNFEIIGEASKRLPETFRAKYTQVPWKTMAGLRDVLIHDYLKVDVDRVWKIIEINLPELKTQIRIIIEREQSSN